MAKTIAKEDIRKEHPQKRTAKRCTLDIKRVAAYCRVSTDKDEQKDSFENQKAHFEEVIKAKPEWQLVKIYSDLGISGTTTEKRDGFNEMISDALHGTIDIILVKNISRFSRRTMDTLNYVNELSKHGVSIIFEEEKIDTSVMVNQMMLTFLSAICQQEVINTSEHAKLGIKYKMQRDILVGSHRCLGYDVDYKNNTMMVIPEEAETVKYIYDRYLAGVGCYRIAKELSEKGIKTPRGNDTWNESVIRDILRNEVYTGDVIQGKTVTIDVLNHRRLDNHGESEQYLIENHHEAIVSKEDFSKVQAIMKSRGHVASGRQFDEKTRRLNTKMYPFSSIMYCGFCGDLYSHRILHAGTKNEKEAWACMTAYKKGKHYCPHSKQINQDILEKAFVETFNKFTATDEDLIAEYIRIAQEELDTDQDEKLCKELNRQMDKAKKDNAKILDLYISSPFDKKDLDGKVRENNQIIAEATEKMEAAKQRMVGAKSKEERLEEFKAAFKKYPSMTEFDPEVFLAVIDKVIIGGYADDGTPDPYRITFVLKTGSKIQQNAKQIKDAIKNNKNVSKAITTDMWRQWY